MRLHLPAALSSSAWAVAAAPLVLAITLLPAAAFAQRPGTRSAPAPVLTSVQPATGGYALLGTGFGAAKDQVRVFEGATEVTRAVESVTETRIEVRSKATGVVRHSVVVAGQATQVLMYTHAAAASILAGTLTTSAAPAAPAPTPAGGSRAPATRALPVTTSGGSGTPGSGSTASTPTAAALTTLALSPATVAGGSAVQGTVTLNAPAPAGGATVTLVHGSGTGPASVTIPAGQTSGTFETASQPVSAAAQLTVQAAYAGVTKTGQVEVTPPATTPAVAVAELWVSSGGTTFNRLSGDRFLTLVNLTALAPLGGALVELTTSHPPMRLYEVPGGGGAILSDGGGSGPYTLMIPAGRIGSGQFEMSLPVVASLTTVTLGARYQGSTVTVQGAVRPAALNSIAVDPARASGGATLTATVWLGGIVAAGGAVVPLAYEGGLAGPSSVAVPAGESSASVEVTAPVVYSNSAAKVKATYGGVTKEAVISVVPAGAVASLTLSRSETSAIYLTRGTVTLAGSTSIDTAVELASDAAAATVPPNVTIPAGQTTATFDIDVEIIDSEQLVTISAGRDAGMRTATLLVKPPPPLINSLSAPERIVGGTPASGQLGLHPMTYNRSFLGEESASVVSSDQSVLRVSGDLRIYETTNRLDFTITTEPVTTTTEVTLQAGFLGPASVTKTILVVPHSVASLEFTPQWSIAPGGSTRGTVTLDAPAPPGGLEVELDADSMNLSVPATVMIPQGQSSATFTATAGTMSPGVTEIIRVTATPPGGTLAEKNVSVGENAHRSD